MPGDNGALGPASDASDAVIDVIRREGPMPTDSTFAKAAKAVFLILILPITIQCIIYILTKNIARSHWVFYTGLIVINDNIVTTILVYSVIASIVSIIGIVSDLRKVVLACTRILLLGTCISVLLVVLLDMINGLDTLDWTGVFIVLFIWSSFYGISMLPSLLITVLMHTRDHAAKKRSTDREHSLE